MHPRTIVVTTLAALCLAPGAFVAHAQRAPAPSAADVGRPFPAWTLPALDDGGPASIERFRGTKVLLHQFASW